MRTRTGMTFAGLALASALVGGVAWATTPGDDGTIQGCKAKKSGALRVVASPADCSKNELSISWNRNGPQGEVGAAGANGSDGKDGANGTDGKDGKDGAGERQEPRDRRAPRVRRVRTGETGCPEWRPLL